MLRENVLSNKHGFSLTTLTIEYDVNIMESVKYATGPLLVEIERNDEDLGIAVTNYSEFATDEIMAAGIFVEKITPASTADRCGALNIGDQLLAINGASLDDWAGTSAEAQRLLKGATKLQILPAHMLRVASRNYITGIAPSKSYFEKINYYT